MLCGMRAPDLLAALSVLASGCSTFSSPNDADAGGPATAEAGPCATPGLSTDKGHFCDTFAGSAVDKNIWPQTDGDVTVADGILTAAPGAGVSVTLTATAAT